MAMNVLTTWKPQISSCLQTRYMSTGLSGLSSRLALRTRVSRPDIEHWTKVRAHVHDLAFPSASSATVPMLGQAHSKFVAERASVPPKNKSLAKELFPSSSPSASQNGSIEQHFKKPAYSMFGSQHSRHANHTDAALKHRSPNIARPSATPAASISSSATVAKAGQAKFASLYKQSSFQDTSSVIDLVDENVSGLTRARSSSRYIAGVLVNDEDFDDDDDLDIDIPIASLPSLPPQPLKETGGRREPPPPTLTSTLSWSQSSPSHFKPRQLFPPDQDGGNITSKRGPSEQDSSPVPVKKRTLPKNWQPRTGEQKLEAMDDNVGSNEGPTIAKGPMWDVTASAVKAQKKQLKTQQRRPFEKPAEKAQAPVAPGSTKHHTPKSAAIHLSTEQQHVRELVVERGQSVFFTGPAGTGKSVLMRAIIADMKRKYARDPERVAVTASTGLAACNIGGMTLHSFSGIGLGKEDVGTLIKKIRRNPKAKNRWLRTKILIMDEVSMVDGDLFDKLSQIGRTIRNNGRPWGGIQLVITGDFFQLPPVPDGKQAQARFAFEAATWSTSIDHTIGLTEVFRQRDPVFAEMLNEMRLGRITEQTVTNFRGLARALQFDDGLEVTELFPTRNEVDSSNERRLRNLPGKARRYEAQDSGTVEPALREKLLVNMMAPKTLDLKIGAQVMLIKNLDETLVNGSLGTVIKFMNETTFELTGGVEGDNADADADERVKKRIKAFGRELERSTSTSGDNTEYPLVRFHAVDGTERVLLMVPEDWKVETPKGEVQAQRKQIPLILAWALSIHKAQGQTLERVKVDLGKIFEKGQAYVALSRATTQEGLQVLNFRKEKVMAHPRVIGFYNKLYSADSAIKKKPMSIADFAHKQASGSGATVRRGNADEDDEEALEAAYG